MERVSVIELKERIYCIHSNKLKASLHFRGKRKKKKQYKENSFPMVPQSGAITKSGQC